MIYCLYISDYHKVCNEQLPYKSDRFGWCRNPERFLNIILTSDGIKI